MPKTLKLQNKPSTTRAPYVPDYYGRELQSELDKSIAQRKLVGQPLPPQYWKTFNPYEEKDE